MAFKVVLHMPEGEKAEELKKDIDIIRYKKACKIIESFGLSEEEYAVLMNSLKKLH